jgi:Tol biopolymer transport system component
MYPFWKPDSREIGFFAVGKLKRVSLAGGTPQDLASTSGQARGGTWNRDGTILFSPSNNSELLRVSENGGRAASVTTIDAPRETGHRWPHFLPDGKHFLYTTRADTGTGIYVGSLDASTPKRLLTDFSNAMYDGTGYLLFVREGALVAQRFDVAALELRAEAFTVVDRIAFAPSTIFGAFSVSSSGVLAYARSGGTTTQLEWFDRQGRSLGVVGEPANYLHPRLSPDESRIAVARLDADANSYDIWLVEAARQAFTKVTYQAANERFPVWSRDGKWIAFASPGKQTLSDLYMKSATAALKDELMLTTSNVTKFPTDWSPDGRWLVFHGGSLQRNGYDLQLFNFDTREPVAFLETQFNELLGRFSPDGKWLSYVSDDSGEFEVYLQRFQVPLSGQRWRVSRRGGSHPLWSADGEELFYVASNSELMAVPIETQNSVPDIGEPSALFTVRLPGVGIQYGRDFAVSRDGSKFLVNTRLPGANGSPITVVLNWSEALRATP